MKRIAAVALLFALTAFAQPPLPPRPDPERLAAYLALDASQRRAWQSIQSEFRASTESLRAQERAIHEQIESARRDADAKLALLLTPEQRTRLEALHQAMEAMRPPR